MKSIRKDVLSFKEFENLNIDVKTLNDNTISDLNKIFSEYPRSCVNKKHSCRMIKLGVTDLYEAFVRLKSLSDIEIRKKENLEFVYGKDLAGKISEYRTKKFRVAKTGVSDRLHQYFILNKIYQKNRITFESLTGYQIQQMTNVLSYFGEERLKDWKSTLIKMISNDVKNYTGRIRWLMNSKKNTDKLSYVLMYGKKEGLRQYSLTNKKKTLHFKNTMKYWINLGYTKEDAEINVKEIQSKRNQKAIQVVKGTSKYSCRSVEFWLNKGRSLEEAEKEVRRVQTTNGLKRYIKIYGLEEGTRLFNLRINEWLSTLNDKSKEEKDLINLKKSHSIEGAKARDLSDEDAIVVRNKNLEHLRKNRAITVSEISQKMCNELELKLDGNTFYHSKNYEYFISGYRVDFYHKSTKTVIEFNGDFFHRNPKLYDEEDVGFGLTSKEIWEYDKERIERIRKNTKYVSQILIVWESDYRKTPDKVINELVDKINGSKNEK